MDFFKGIGDFFRGIFGGDDDEEEKRKRKEQARRAQQAQKKDSNLFSFQTTPERNRSKEQDDRQQFMAPKVEKKKNPTLTIDEFVKTKQPPAPAKSKQVKTLGQTYTRQKDGSYIGSAGQRRTEKQLREFMRIEDKDKATQNKIRTDQTIGNIMQPVSAVKEVVVEPLVRIPETALRSGYELVTGQDASQKEKNTGLRALLYGEDGVETYGRQGEDASRAIKETTGADLPAPLLALALAGLDLGGLGLVGAAKRAATKTARTTLNNSGKEVASGTASKESVKTATEEGTKRVIQKLEEDTGRKLTSEEAQAIGTKVEDAVKKEVDAATPKADTPTDPSIPTRESVAEDYKNVFNKINEDTNLTPEQKIAVQAEAKTRHADLLKQIDESNAKQQQIVDEAAQAQAAQQAKQAGAIEEVQANQAAAITPPENAPAATQPMANPEATANDAYANYGLDEAYQGVDAQTARIGEATQATDNPLMKMVNAVRAQTSDRYRAGVDAVREKVNDTIYQKGIASENSTNAAIARAPRLLFDKFGMSDAARMLPNQVDAAKSANAIRVHAQARDVDELFKATDDPAEAAKRLYQVFETPDMLIRMYGDDTAKLLPTDLTPPEKAIFDRLVELNKVRNEVWMKIVDERFKAGLISPEEHAKRLENYNSELAKSGMHSPRIYDFDAADMGFKVKGNSNRGAFMGRKDLAEINQGTIETLNANPAQSMLFRLQTGLDELARIDTIKKLEEAGYITDTPPNKNFVKLEGGQYGIANGKFADKQIVGTLEGKQIFNTDAGQKASDLLDVYRNSVLGTLDRAVKKSKTVYSPGTFIGNLFSNPLLFNRGAGVSAPTQMFNMAKNTRTLHSHLEGKQLDPDILDMQRMGIKLGNTADELTGSSQNYKVLGTGGKMQALKEIALSPNKVYAGTDDLAKVTIYKTLLRRGMDKETAALRATQFTQDYGNAGRAIQMLADSPVLGQPFARFVPELVRLTKNNLLYNPVGTFAGVFGLAHLQQYLHKQSGETEEERRVREDAPGKVKVPFTGWVNQMVGAEGDVSLDFPVGDTAINAARALGFNFPQEPGTDAMTSLMKNLAPFTIPFMETPNGETEFQPQQLVSSMLLRPLAEQAANKDFMGRNVDDPLNKTRWEMSGGDEKKYSDELPEDTKTANRLYHLFMNWAPMSGEADALATKSGLRDQLTRPGQLDEGKDYYGKERTDTQAFWRALGLKVEANDPEARKQRVATDKYFTEDLPATQAWLNENEDLAETYWKLKSTAKDRNSLVKANDVITPERWQLIQSDKSGRLLRFLGEQEKRIHNMSVADNAEDPSKPIKPVDPIYNLSDQQQRVVSEIMSRPTGDDKEAEQILRATQPWFVDFEKNRRDYYELNNKYYDAQDIESKSKQNPRVEEYYSIEYPEQPPLIQRYYQIMNEQGKDAAKAWGKTQGDALSDAFDADSAARLKYTNAKRKIEGYPPIKEEVWNNDTYGYDADDKGYGYGKGGGSYTDDENVLNYLLNLGNDVKRLDSLTEGEKQVVLNLQKFFAARRGGRATVQLGASASGNPRA